MLDAVALGNYSKEDNCVKEMELEAAKLEFNAVVGKKTRQTFMLVAVALGN